MDDKIFGKRLYKVVGPTKVCDDVEVYEVWKRKVCRTCSEFSDPQGYISHNEWFYITQVSKGIIGISHPIVIEMGIDYKQLSFLICRDNKCYIIGAHTLTCSKSRDISSMLREVIFEGGISMHLVVANGIIALTGDSCFLRDTGKAQRREKLCYMISEKYGLNRSHFDCYSWETTKKNLKAQLVARKKQLNRYQDKVLIGGIDKFRKANWIMYEKAQIPEIEDGNLVKVQVSIQYKGDKKYLAVSADTSIVYIPYNAIELLRSKVTYLPRGFETELPVKALEYLKKNPDYIRTQIADIPIYKWAVSRLLFWINVAKQTRKM